MKVNIILESKKEVEHFTSIFALGLISALEHKIIELEYAEQYLFNPYNLNKLHEAEVDDLLIEIVHLGTELEDIRSLLPDKLNEEILDLKSRVIKFLKNNRINESSINRIFKNIVID